MGTNRILKLREPGSFIVSYPEEDITFIYPEEDIPYYSEEDITFITLDNKETHPLLLRKPLSLSSKGIFPILTSLKRVWNKESQCLCLQDIQKHERPKENCHPTFLGRGKEQVLCCMKVFRDPDWWWFSYVEYVASEVVLGDGGVTIPDSWKEKGLEKRAWKVLWSKLESGACHLLMFLPRTGHMVTPHCSRSRDT